MGRFSLLCVLVAFVFASTRNTSQSIRAFQHARHDTNNITLVISNFGKFGQGESGNYGGCWWRYSGWLTNYYIYGAGIWFGTVDSLTGDTLVTCGYEWGYSEFAPGLQGMSVNDPAAIIYKYPDNWPPPESVFPMAPQEAVSDQDSWCCFNDCDSIYHMPGDTRPIGLEVYQTIYTWDRPEVVDIIFLLYDVKNVSGHVLRDCYIGIATDCDIGLDMPATDDRCTGIVEHVYIIDEDTITVDDVGYQWQDEPEGGWPIFPAVIGFDLLQTPFELQLDQDKDGDGIPDQYERDSTYYVNNLPQYLWDVDNDGVPDWRDPSQWPQLGMTAFKWINQVPDPNSDPERFLTMAGYNFLTGQYEPYDTIIPDPNDQRFLMSSGPYDLELDSTVTLVLGVMITAWSNMYPGAPPGYPTFATPDSALALVDNWAQLYYDMYWYLYTGIEENAIVERPNKGLTIHPNPIAGNATIHFSLVEPGIVSLKIYNTLGQLAENVFVGEKSAGNHYIALDTRKLAQGTYFLVLETPTSTQSQSFVLLW